jgi:TolB protein
MTQKLNNPTTSTNPNQGSLNNLPRHSAPEPISRLEQPGFARPRINWRLIIWSLFGTWVTLGLIYSQNLFSALPSRQTIAAESTIFVVFSPTPTPVATPTLAASPASSPQPFTFAQATDVPTPVPGGRTLILIPATGDSGWVVSDDESVVTIYDPQNHFGDSYLYAGVLDDKIYHAALQFDLKQVPRGTKIYAASLHLTGLRTDQMTEQGEWRLQLLSSAYDARWRNHNYWQIHEAEVASTFAPVLTPEQLGEGQENIFQFTPEQIKLLERRIFEGSDTFGRKISFRLDGPLNGSSNLFAWDSGTGPASKGKRAGPALFLSLGPPPSKTPEPYYVVITSTPTPQDITTAVARSAQMTVQAERDGTATPLPAHWVTPFVVTPTPTAENEATAQLMSEMATAIALTTGEPPNLATATPTPTYVIITSTSTPENVSTAAAEALQVTAAARQNGTATPFPPNWVTPVVVTPTPMPENTATVEYLLAVVLTTGTPTATPANVQTATATPIFITVEPFASSTAMATPTATPQPIPPGLLGKIVFLSGREGATEEERLRADRLKATPQVIPQPYVYDPQTGQLGRLTNIWPYQVAAGRDAWSADTNFEAYTQKLLWTNFNDFPTTVFAIHYYDHKYQVETQVTYLGAGWTWDPAWSPVGNQIAFVSNVSKDDEIWIINHDGSGGLQLTTSNEAHNAREIGKDTFIPEVNGHPSWSPDGSQIIFWSNRTGNRQIWIMNADGSNQRLLMNELNPYDDFDPVWIKYPDPAPPLLRQPDWRFIKPVEEAQNSR